MNLLTIKGNAFKGTFDGQGYALKNLKLAYGGSAANTAYGLFGSAGRRDGAQPDGRVRPWAMRAH